MKGSSLDALLLLLKDPDRDTFEAVSESLVLDSKLIPTLENLWNRADDEISVSRLDWLMRRARFNTLYEKLAEWKKSCPADIIEGAWLVATYQQPYLTFAEVSEAVDKIVKDAWVKLNEEQRPKEKVTALNHIFFSKFGFKGDRNNIDSLDNAYIHHVLRTKNGNDVSLAILYIGVAQRLHIPIYGVPLPGNFISVFVDDDVTCEDAPLGADVLFYINPFMDGAHFDSPEITGYVRKLNIPVQHAYYRPCSNATVIGTLLERLLSLYEEKNMSENAADLKALLKIFSKDILSGDGYPPM